MKWILRLVGLQKKKKRTPMPPKPYVDVSNTGKHMSNPKYYDMNDLKNVDPEKPHWHDPRFESRESAPFFDFFGFNRDWSYSLFKVSSIFFVLLFYYEFRLIMQMGENDLKLSSTTTVSATPDYARDDKGIAEELQKAGFAYVGVKKLDNLGNNNGATKQ